MARANKVIVIGGGLAGLTSAIELVDRGFDVTVIESGARCGGKLESWKDAEGDPIEHGIHGWWPSAVNLFDVIAHVGIRADAFQRAAFALQIMPGGSQLRMKPLVHRLPAPLFLLVHYCLAHSFNPIEILILSRFTASLLGFDVQRDYEELDQVTFHTWLSGRGVSPQIYKLYFEPYVRSFAFASAETVSAAAVLSSMQFYLLRDQDDIVPSWSTDDPQTLIIDPMVSYINSHGGRVLTGTRVEQLQLEHGARIGGVGLAGHDQSHMAADHFIVALDLQSCRRLIEASGLQRGALSRLDALETTDVIVVRVWFPGKNLLRDVTSGVFIEADFLDNFLVVSNMQQCAMKRDETVIEAHSYMAQEKTRLDPLHLFDLALRDLRKAFPALNIVPRKHYVRIYHGLVAHHAAGTHRWVPDVATPLDNLYLAGDWVGRFPRVWHMERAVVTARLAVSQILLKTGEPSLNILSPRNGGPLLEVIMRTLRILGRCRRGMGRLIRGEPRPPSPSATTPER